ncbi:hypothetical protein [Panacagrimonas perspica]|uniref:hypothetical protein n=1 Tax=Panacagrimonas perspica TaxID=381431 RepID=UPI001FE49748|nr:hypothetical protein [Panacagrimonas perspica]
MRGLRKVFAEILVRRRGSEDIAASVVVQHHAVRLGAFGGDTQGGDTARIDLLDFRADVAAALREHLVPFAPHLRQGHVAPGAEDSLQVVDDDVELLLRHVGLRRPVR